MSRKRPEPFNVLCMFILLLCLGGTVHITASSFISFIGFDYC